MVLWRGKSYRNIIHDLGLSIKPKTYLSDALNFTQCFCPFKVLTWNCWGGTITTRPAGSFFFYQIRKSQNSRRGVRKRKARMTRRAGRIRPPHGRIKRFNRRRGRNHNYSGSPLIPVVSFIFAQQLENINRARVNMYQLIKTTFDQDTLAAGQVTFATPRK